MNTRSIVAALGDLISPISEATGIRIAIEEVEVVLAHEELGRVNGINFGSTFSMPSIRGTLVSLPVRSMIPDS
jgi:hypothetical protein